MIRFKTINVDGMEIVREFDTVEDVENDFYSEDCSLPENDDVVLEAEYDGEQIDAETFYDVILALGIE